MRALPLLGFLLLFACAEKDLTDLQAAWKIDSVYNYYNGYGLMTYGSDPEIIYHFQPDGRLRMTLDKEFRYLFYELKQDTLTYTDNKSRIVEKFTVLSISDEQLALQKKKTPLFNEKRQDRYEIRYLSKVHED
ncbi:hypothetical protein [Ohtaekwangia koreensis]|uniref:Lipocalin-like domain-containing protein n=1 Tax=Ohtaekwangia koreensis TaxID=688867 RepID=A0A1T5JG33_9BACT|nr:hypothetical protein [Ohtaekwangia koreensis]SKC50431.1 hypothetical protein SAMN05660236_1074 [Ohtaekwangia koreensis]